MQLKTVEEVVDSLEPIFTQADQYEKDNGYESLVPARQLAQSVLTQDRADIRAVLREVIGNQLGFELDENGDPLLRKQDIITLIDTLLPGDVSK